MGARLTAARHNRHSTHVGGGWIIHLCRVREQTWFMGHLDPVLRPHWARMLPSNCCWSEQWSQLRREIFHLCLQSRDRFPLTPIPEWSSCLDNLPTRSIVHAKRSQNLLRDWSRWKTTLVHAQQSPRARPSTPSCQPRRGFPRQETTL